jgi:hypothetical protein
MFIRSTFNVFVLLLEIPVWILDIPASNYYFLLFLPNLPQDRRQTDPVASVPSFLICLPSPTIEVILNVLIPSSF